jgi:ferredoxin
MSYIVTRLCIDCVDTACMVVCPVNCFYVPKTPSKERPEQLYISPDECINCDACVPECPWEAIFNEDDTPKIFADDIPLNALCDKERDQFNPAEHLDKPQPDADQIAANKKKWGLEG